jgi:hypothetical protein
MWLDYVQVIVNFLLIGLLLDSINSDIKKKKKAERFVREFKDETDRFVSGISAAYIPANRGSMCDAGAVPVNGIIYKTVNNSIAWLKARKDGNMWIFVKLADSQSWAPMVIATNQDIADAIASKVADETALAIKSEAYQREISNQNYSGEQMIKTYLPL